MGFCAVRREGIKGGCRKGMKTRRRASVVVTRPLECLIVLTLWILTSSFQLKLRDRARTKFFAAPGDRYSSMTPQRPSISTLLLPLLWCSGQA